MTRIECFKGTYLEIYNGIYVGGRALCSDGKVRRIKRIAPTPDTFFSIPASVVYRGKTVSGFVAIDRMYPNDDSSEDMVVKFLSYKYRKNGHIIPEVSD